jgi:hypothetical protein
MLKGEDVVGALGDGTRDEEDAGTIVWQSSSVWMEDHVEAALEEMEVEVLMVLEGHLRRRGEWPR